MDLAAARSSASIPELYDPVGLYNMMAKAVQHCLSAECTQVALEQSFNDEEDFDPLYAEYIAGHVWAEFVRKLGVG